MPSPLLALAFLYICLTSGERNNVPKPNILKSQHAPKPNICQRAGGDVVPPQQSQPVEPEMHERREKNHWSIDPGDSVERVVNRIAPLHSKELGIVNQEIVRISESEIDFGEVPAHRYSVDSFHASEVACEPLFQQIRDGKLHRRSMPSLDWNELAAHMNTGYRWRDAMDRFSPTSYSSFDDWFLRHLTDETTAECLENAAKAEVCSPVEANIRSLQGSFPSGMVTLKTTLIAVEDLLRVVDGGQLLQFALQKTDYHRVHSPVDGVVEDVHEYQRDELFDGADSMTIFTFSTSIGRVKMMCVGEGSVQSFVTLSEVTKGSQVHKMDELGHFDFGSQVLLVLPAGIKHDMATNLPVFPGDGIVMTETGV